MTTITVDAALDPLHEDLGKLIRAAHLEDASGARRYLESILVRRDFGAVAHFLNVSDTRASQIMRELVAKYGEP